MGVELICVFVALVAGMVLPLSDGVVVESQTEQDRRGSDRIEGRYTVAYRPLARGPHSAGGLARPSSRSKVRFLLRAMNRQ
jgi:hypothetical protein